MPGPLCQKRLKQHVATAADLVELSPAEEILMIGYPNGIWDDVNNMPVFRRKIAVTYPGKM
jgi:hypothetical protein